MFILASLSFGECLVHCFTLSLSVCLSLSLSLSLRLSLSLCLSLSVSLSLCLSLSLFVSLYLRLKLFLSFSLHGSRFLPLPPSYAILLCHITCFFFFFFLHKLPSFKGHVLAIGGFWVLKMVLKEKWWSTDVSRWNTRDAMTSHLFCAISSRHFYILFIAFDSNVMFAFDLELTFLWPFVLLTFHCVVNSYTTSCNTGLPPLTLPVCTQHLYHQLYLSHSLCTL